jgi:tRNA (cytidine32/uridine32-2'-O)-methyltransferase
MLDRVSVVMVGTSHPGNIGATARAMAVMGLSKLVLAKPRCEVNEQSEAMASKGVSVLQNRIETPSLAEALSG